MKKLAIITTLFVSITIGGFAQQETDNREKFQFGLKAGLNYSNVYDEKGMLLAVGKVLIKMK